MVKRAFIRNQTKLQNHKSLIKEMANTRRRLMRRSAQAEKAGRYEDAKQLREAYENYKYRSFQKQYNYVVDPQLKEEFIQSAIKTERTRVSGLISRNATGTKGEEKKYQRQNELFKREYKQYAIYATKLGWISGKNIKEKNVYDQIVKHIAEELGIDESEVTVEDINNFFNRKDFREWMSMVTGSDAWIDPDYANIHSNKYTVYVRNRNNSSRR